MPYSENYSVSSLGVIDYNDLEMTLTRDALPNKQTMDNFKFSLNSIDEGELGTFRRSLVTPMSVNNVQDPMYAEFEKSRNFHKQYIMYNNLKKSVRLSPTLSSAGSVADSLAVFNRFIDDHSTDDFVRGDLNDFMSPYNMDDLISLPPTTPSPQMGRATVAKNNGMAPIGSKGVSNTTVNNNTYVKPRKVSIDACVQTPSCFDDTNPVSPNSSSSNERYRNLKNPKEEPIKTLQPKQTETRRWSSYLPDSKPERPTTTSKLAQLSNRNRLSTVNITRAEPTTADMNKKSSNVTQMNRAPLLSGVKSKPETKRNSTTGVYNSNRNSLRNNFQEELTPVYVPAGHRELTDTRTNMARREPTATNTTAHHHEKVDSDVYLQRRLSLMINTDEQATSVAKEQQQRREIPVSRYSYKQVSTRAKEALKPIKSEQPQKSIFSSRSRPAPTEPKPIKDVSAIKQPERSVFNPRRHLIHRADELVSSRVPDVNENRGHADQLKHGSNDTARRASYRDRIVSYKEPVTTTATATATDKPSYSVSKRLSSSALPTSSVPTSAIPAPSTSRAVPTISTQLRRARSLTVPSSRYGYKESDANVSSMPVPIFRHRKQASKYASVPEDKVAPPPPAPVAAAPATTSPAKAVRFSFPIRRISNNDIQPVPAYSSSGNSNIKTSSSRSYDVDSLSSTAAAAAASPTPAATSPAQGARLSFPIRRISNNDIQLVPSYSSSGYSNTTTSSSRSDDVDSIPSTPPDRVKSGYLNRARETYDPSSYQRQRVLSEDNHQYKDKQRKCVTESAREVLAHVQERRAKNAIILNSIHHR